MNKFQTLSHRFRLKLAANSPFAPSWRSQQPKSSPDFHPNPERHLDEIQSGKKDSKAPANPLFSPGFNKDYKHTFYIASDEAAGASHALESVARNAKTLGLSIEHTGGALKLINDYTGNFLIIDAIPSKAAQQRSIQTHALSEIFQWVEGLAAPEPPVDKLPASLDALWKLALDALKKNNLTLIETSGVPLDYFLVNFFNPKSEIAFSLIVSHHELEGGYGFSITPNDTHIERGDSGSFASAKQFITDSINHAAI